MKALSLRQPWAFAVVHLGKSLENRTWNTKFRGEFLIHASKGMTRAEHDDAAAFMALRVPHMRAILPRLEELTEANGHRGGIVGRARLVDVIPPCDPSRPCKEPWHMHAQFGFRLEDVRSVPFISCGGSLGFFNVPFAVEQAVGNAK